MTVCNSCRYCEGLCAVFPAMEMRRAFAGRRSQLPRQSLSWLRRLLLRLPVLAAARVRRQRAEDPGPGARRFLPRLCLAAALSGLFARNGRAVANIAALSVAVFASASSPSMIRRRCSPSIAGRARSIADAARRDGVDFRRRVPLCDRRARHERALSGATSPSRERRPSRARSARRSRTPAGCAISTAAAAAA